MISKLMSYWNFGTTFCSVEITGALASETVFITSAKKKKGEFKDIEYLKSSSKNSLDKILPKNQHCFLTINTDQVLIKETPLSEDIQKTVSQTFPGLSLSDFYYEILKTKKKSFVAVCRKKYVQDILKELEFQKLNVLGITLGFTSLSKLIPLLKEDEIVSSRYRFVLENKSIFSFEENVNNSNTYLVEDINVHSDYLISLSGLFNYVSNSNDSISNIDTENARLKGLSTQKNFFRKGIQFATGILLGLLLINFLIFSSAFKQHQTLQEEVELLKNRKDVFITKQTIVKTKEQLVENILNSRSSKSSYYTNKIIASKPTSILFNNIQFQPLKKNIRPDKKIEYTQKEISISGDSIEKDLFSNWIETLEQLDWIDQVTVTQYGFSKTNVATFSVSLLLKE